MADLSVVKLFAGLPPKELKQIEADLTVVTQPAGKDIMLSGSKGVGFMVILAGEVKVSLARERTLTLGPGDHFGEMALLDQKGRSGSVTALTDVTLGSVVQWKFKDFLAHHPEVAWRVMQSLSERLREVQVD
ncbi:MAG: Crp/Fnr family transcriptional regulator [Candidatus Dormibacteria bacterium]